jgi:hypothetical protein
VWKTLIDRGQKQLMVQQVETEYLILGAGMAGLMAAQWLQHAGKRPLLIDKGVSVGGRLATWRISSGVADHGAQFFTVRDADFQKLVDTWAASGLVYVWSRGWSDGSITDTPRDGYPRYVAHDGLNTLAKRLAQDLDCRLNVKIEAIRYHNGLMQAQAEDGTVYLAQKLLLTPPVPQSLALLTAGGVALGADDAAELGRIEYDPCLVGLFAVTGDVYLPEPGALQRPYADIAWIADNRRKGISPDMCVITMQASVAFSRTYYDETDEALTARFKAELVAFMNPSAHILEAHIKRWRYSQPTTLYRARCCVAKGLPLVFAGDAFAGPRVEGAALSGLAAAQAMLTSS